MKKNALILMSLLICPVVLMAQRVTNYLKTGETLQFNNKTYHLGWSSHPTDAYYVQEYFPEGEKAESYHEMFTVSVLYGDAITPKLGVTTKVLDLQIGSYMHQLIAQTDLVTPFA